MTYLPYTPFLLLLFISCSGADKAPPDTAPPGDSPADTGEPAWTTLPAGCAAPAELPEDPLTLVGSVRVGQVDGSGFLEALDVEVSGELAFAVGQGGLLIFDVSAPAAPEKLYGPWESWRGKLHRVEPLAEGYLATSQRDEGVYLWDVSDPSVATVVGTIEDAGLEGLHYADGLLFVTARDEGLRVYDVSDPSAPSLVASAPGLDAPWELAATGDGWLYAADNTLGVVPIDVRNPLSPVVGTPVALDAPALHARYVDDRVYASAGGDGVVILDVSTRDAPTLMDRVVTGGSAVMSDVSDGRLWVVDHEGVLVFDLSEDPPAPLQAEATEQFALAVDAEGGLAYVGDWNLLEIWSIDAGIEAGALDLPSETLRWSGGEASATLTNRGAGALRLLGATVDDPAVAVEVSTTTLGPGESATLRLSGLTADTSACLASDDPDDPVLALEVRSAAAPPAGEAAPDFALQDLDGQTHRLSEQLGHPVLLAYFATW